MPTTPKRKASLGAKVAKLANVFSSKGTRAKSPRRSPSLPPSSSPIPVLPLADRPMPDDLDEIEQRFNEAIEQLGIQDEEKKKNLVDRYGTPQLKWRMIMDTERSRQASKQGSKANPDHFIALLREIALESIRSQAKLLTDELLQLNVHVRGQPLKWLHELLNKGALEEIVRILSLFSTLKEASPAVIELEETFVNVLQSIMNIKEGVSHFLKVPCSVRTLVSLLFSIERARSKSILVLLLILFASYDLEGFNLVIDAFTNAKLVYREKYRFEILVKQLTESGNFDFKFNGLMLLNTLLNYADDVNVRSAIQTELINLDTMKRFSDLNIVDADFVSQLKEFEVELKSDIGATFTTANDPASLVNLIARQLGNTKVLVDILNDMLSLSNMAQDDATSTANWNILYSLIHSVIGNVDVNGKIKNLTEEDEKLRSQIRTFESSIVDTERKLKLEKQRILEYVDQGQQPNESDFEFLKELLVKVIDLKTQIQRFENAVNEKEKKFQADTLKMSSEKQKVSSERNRILSEKQKILDFIVQGKKPNISDFEYLKELVVKIIELKTKEESAPVSTSTTIPVAAVQTPAPSSVLAKTEASVTGAPPAPPVQSTESSPPPLPSMGGAPPLPPPSMGGGPPPPPPPPMGGGPPPPPPPPMGGGPPPPPPMGGGPPPPPPMGGGMRGPPAMGSTMNLPKLPTYNPKTDLRNFHIETIAKNKINNTIFVKKKITEATNNIELNTTEIEELFAVKKSTPEITSSSGGQQKSTLVSLIDPKRSYNIGIQLGSMRLSNELIRAAIIQMDNSKLSNSQINVLKQICPTEEEVELVSNYDGNIENLESPERFFKALSTIPHLQGRLEAWSFKMRFDDDVSNLRPNMDCIRLAVGELKESEKFTKFLSLVLAISNYLNAKGNKKNAYGFKLASLHKLKETKTADGKSHLLIYIIEFIESKYPDLLHFYTELSNVSNAKKIAVSQIKETILNMKKETDKLAKIVHKYEAAQNHDPDDCFLKIMKPFQKNAVETLENMESKFETLSKQLEELAVLFDEDKGMMLNKPEDFFTNLDSFFQLYQETLQKLIDNRKKEVDKKKKDSRSNTPSKEASGIMNAKGAMQKNKLPGLNEGLLNDLRANMKSGEIFAKRRTMRLNSPEIENAIKENIFAKEAVLTKNKK
jgi:hypothetical protein